MSCSVDASSRPTYVRPSWGRSRKTKSVTSQNSLKLLMFTSSSAVTDINPALRMKSVSQTMTCLCVSGVPLTFRWYRMMPVLSRSSSMPMRWGSSESSTTPMPSFLRARVSSCRRVHTDHSLKPEQSSNKALTLVDQWLWNCRDCSKHAF